jgi:hypothetical protein
LAYTLYGMPLIYNGQEVGGNQALNYFDDTKINWTTKDDKMRNTIRTLTALKHAVPALDDKTDVNWVTLNPANSNVLAYKRKAGNSEILVVLNMATQASSATLTGITAGDWSLWLNSETIVQGVSRKQQTFSSTQTITLDAKGYRVYVKGTFSEEEPPAPEVYVPTLNNSDEVSVFFETATVDTYAVWAWGTLGGGEAYCTNTSWPGDDMMLMGQTATGSYVYKCILTKTNEIPQYLIISKNGGDAKIYDGITFVNHGYYVEGQTTPTQIISAITGIKSVYDSPNGDSRIYDLSGRQVVKNRDLTNGIYIRNGKKIVIK